MGNSQKEVDYQLGTHTMDTSGSIVEDEHVIDFEVETEAVFRRLADDIYKSPEAGIREPLTNAITTVRRVFESREENGMIEITVQDGDQVMLRLRDTGEGISKAVLNKVLTVIGRSNAIDDGELSGQYGMGFLASYKLVGLDGGFLMCTNPRDSEEGPYSGLFKPGTFEPDKNDSLPKILDEDEYGTVFEYYIRNDISISDIRDWVENHSRWSPVPIRYVELDEDGNESYNEDYGCKKLEERYDRPSISVSNEYFEAATSPDAENDIVLISSPVEMYGTRNLRRSLPWQVDLRLKYENGVVFKGPNEGMIPVKRAEYEAMDETRRENYIPKNELEDEDMCLPESTGTRERLRKNRPFLKHVNKLLKEKYLDKVSETLEDFEPSSMSLQDVSPMKKHILLRIFKEFDNIDKEYSQSHISSKLSRSYNYDNPSDETLSFIQTMTKSVKLVSERKGASPPYYQYPKEIVHELRENDGRVFMCISKNSWKAKAVEEADEETHIISLESASEYDTFEEHLEWEKLKNIKRSNATELLELTEDELENIRPPSSEDKDSSETKLTVHYESGGRTIFNRTVEQVEEHFKHPNTSSQLGSALILFTVTGDKNVSDYYWLADRNCSVARCKKGTVEKLTENNERIMRFEEYEQWVLNRRVMSSEGQITLRSTVEKDEPVSYYVLDSSRDILMNKSVLEKLSEGTRKEKFQNELFAVVELDDWEHFMNIKDRLPEGDYMTNTMDCRTAKYLGGQRTIDEVDTYLRAHFDETVVNSDEFSALKRSHDKVSRQLLRDMKLLNLSYKANDGLASEEEDESKMQLPEHRTQDGFMTIEEIYEKYSHDEVIIHVLSNGKMKYFDDSDFMSRATSILPDAELPKYGSEECSSSSLYVPMLESEYESIKGRVKSESTVLGVWSRRSDNTYNVDCKYVYAATELNDWEDKFVSNLVSSTGLESAISLVDTLKVAHDQGVEPSSLQFEI
jgi:hypothetical protein